MRLIIEHISDYNVALLKKLSEDIIGDKLVIIISKENSIGIQKLKNFGFIKEKETKKSIYLTI